jgi:GH24 family phage-related lysozyme (muramidase)
VSAQYEIEFLPILKGFEGCVPTMYLDTVGNVTCGVGFELETALVAQGFPWYIDPACTVPATPQEIAAAWVRVKAMVPGKMPAFYTYDGCLQLEQQDIDAHLLGILDQTYEDLQRDYPGFEGFTDAWKMALADMDYNLGDAKLRNTYPKFDAAVDVGDGPGAAAQCKRNGISAARNLWCAQCFDPTFTS